MSQYTNTTFPLLVGSSQYLPLIVSFPSLAFISWQDNAGKSGIEPKGAAIKVWLFVLLYVLGGIVFSVVSQNQQQSKWKNSHGINEKSIKHMNLTEKVDDCKGNDIHYPNSNNIIVKTRWYPSNENLFFQVQIYLQFEAEYTTRERSKSWAMIIQEETGLVKDREYCW